MTTYPREMLKAGAAVICHCEGAHGIAMTHAEIAAAVLDATLGLSQFELDVISERRRQIMEEGWTAEHDDKHGDGELAAAAACYALSGTKWEFILGRLLELLWPWNRTWWKPGGGRRRRLVKSGALIFAEGDLTDRVAAKQALSQEPTP